MKGAYNVQHVHLISATMAGRRNKLLGFGQTKTIKFGTLSLISHTQSCLFWNLFFIHITPWVSHEKLKTVYFYWKAKMYIFDCQQIWKMHYILGRSSLWALQCKVVLLCFILFWVLHCRITLFIFYIFYLDIWKIRYSMFEAFALDTIRIWQTNKQKTSITTNKGFLGTYIKSKNNSIYTVYIHN